MTPIDQQLLGAIKAIHEVGDRNRAHPFNLYTDVTVAKDIFRVSDSTIRNALKRLEKQGLIRKIRTPGGVNRRGLVYWIPTEEVEL